MENQLAKAINLARRTGDRLIVFDYRNQNPFVVMSLDEYEKMVIGHSEVKGLTEDELLDKINRDIAVWKSEQETNISENIKDRIVLPQRESRAESIDSEPILDNFTEDYSEDEIIPEREEKEKKRSFWKIPEDRKEGAEEIIEEDRQYLEEI